MIAKYLFQAILIIVITGFMASNVWSECFYPRDCTLFPTDTSSENLRVECQFFGDPPNSLPGDGSRVKFCIPAGFKESGEVAPTGNGSSPIGIACGDLFSYRVLVWNAFAEFKSPFLGGNVNITFKGVEVGFPVPGNQNCKAYQPVFGDSRFDGLCGGNATVSTLACPEL